ncbi:MAG: DNA polymerase III subunit delta' [Robiginitomaculum sp.]|nr:DNA polymerase III subunit delta' [Robiginitomaculum sp.]
MARAVQKHTDHMPSNPEADKADHCPHPREVYSLIGHEHNEQNFAKLFEQNQLHHAWLISGAKGIGKATLAYRMIRRVLGGVAQTAGHLDIPQSDAVAQRVQSLGHGDFLLVRRPYDVKSKKLKAEIPVTEARKISDFFSRKPSEGGWRVSLIDSMDEMNRNAANAVLKTLEEPPEKALIILLTSAPGRLLPTIRSRCMDMSLRPVETTALNHWLEGRTNASSKDVEAAIMLSQGAPGKAYALAQNADTVLRPLRGFLENFPKSSPSMLHMISDALSAQKANVSYGLFWSALEDILHAQAIYAATGQWDSAFSPIKQVKSPDEWLDIRKNLQSQYRAQAGLNMNKKTVLLNALSQIGI